MTPAAWLIARRALLHRPWRSAVLLFGFGAGVAIMIGLLSVGDALLLEAQDRNLVAGGDVVVLPEGLDPAVIKVNGVTGLFLTIPNASFLVRDVLGGPRFHAAVAAAAPQITNRLLYVRAHGRVVAAVASGGIPSLDRAARAARAVAGADSAADRAWLRPSVVSLAGRLDRFHAMPAGAGFFTRAAWAEWDYFTVVDPATRAYAYLTIVTGTNGVGAAVARVAVPGEPPADALVSAALRPGDISTTGADQRVGPATVEVDARGYHVTVNAPRLRVDLRIRPDRGFVLPASEVRMGGAVTGYTAPIVRGRADGTIRVPGRTLVMSDAPAYHDHNWGTWRGATWDWGQASSPAGALVYASVHPPGGAVAADERATLFLWEDGGPAEQRGGFAAALPVRDVTYGGWHPGPTVNGRAVRAPADATIHATNGSDAVTVRIRVWSALASPPLGGASGPAKAGGGNIFLQLRGDAALRGTIGGHPVAWQGPAAAETFVRP